MSGWTFNETDRQAMIDPFYLPVIRKIAASAGTRSLRLTSHNIHRYSSCSAANSFSCSAKNIARCHTQAKQRGALGWHQIKRLRLPKMRELVPKRELKKLEEALGRPGAARTQVEDGGGRRTLFDL